MRLNSLTNNFNKEILDMIDRFAYDMHLIKRDESKICTCIVHSTSQADPSCKKCLGTGYRISIIKVKAAAQDTKLPTTFRSDDFVVARNFFLKSEHYLDENDLVVDKRTVYMVMEQQELISLKGTLPYSKICAVKKKFDSKIFFENFNEIINKR